MRIVYVTARLPFGPGEAFLLPEIEALRARGHEVRIVPLRAEGDVVHEAAQPLLPITLSRPLRRPPGMAAALRTLVSAPRAAIGSLAPIAGSLRPYHLLGNLSVYPRALWLADYARRFRADHIHAHWASFSATLAMLAGAISGTPWSVTAHRYDLVEDNLLVEKLARASFVRFISRSGLSLCARSIGRAVVEGERAFVLHVGVALPAFFAERPLASTGRPVLVCPANVIPVKGHRYLVEAMARLAAQGRDAELWIAGRGPLVPALEGQARALGVAERVRFLGVVPHDELLSRYRDGRVRGVALPSVDLGGGEHEGIPVALIEAMGAGVPVVGTRTGGIPELLDGGAGLLVPHRDPVALEGALARLLDDSADARGAVARMVATARARVEAEYDVGAIVASLEARFAAAAGRSPSGEQGDRAWGELRSLLG